MSGIADEIMKRIRAKGRGKWVCTPKDFLDLGERAAVDQALSRLARSGKLRRASRGLYDLPRMSRILGRHAPPDIDAAIAAIARRDGIRIVPDGIDAASRLGFINDVPAKIVYMTDGPSRTVKIGRRTVRFRHASPKVMSWADSPKAAPVAQALRWLGPRAASDARVATRLVRMLPDAVKEDFIQRSASLPDWTRPITRRLMESRAEAR